MTEIAHVHLTTGAVDSYEYGSYPLADEPEPASEERHIFYALSPEGALILGTAQVSLRMGADEITDHPHRFAVKVTYAPGVWVKIVGGMLAMEE